MVLIRVYGSNTDLLVSREMEILTIRVLRKRMRTQPIHCRFENGFAYGYAAGVCLDTESIRDPIVSR